MLVDGGIMAGKRGYPRAERGGRAGPATPGEARELIIETVGAQGDGLAGGVYVPLVLPGETIRALVRGDRGELLEVVSPSGERIVPPCPHFGDCGGCALQHWEASAYLAWKAEQIRLALGRERIETQILPPVTAPLGSRRRLALHARREGREAVIGFKARRSWRLARIEACVIADPPLVAAVPALRRFAEPFLEHPQSAPTLHVTPTGTRLHVDVNR